jgi:hypothetical protein
VNGNPLQDIRLLENAVFVMKDGAVHHAATGWAAPVTSVTGAARRA